MIGVDVIDGVCCSGQLKIIVIEIILFMKVPVKLHVRLQIRRACKSFQTHLALPRFLAGVH